MNMFKITVFNFDVGRGAYGFFSLQELIIFKLFKYKLFMEKTRLTCKKERGRQIDN